MTTSSSRPRVAIAHDYLTQRGGAERVVLAMSRIFPEAPIYTTLYNPKTTFPEFEGKRIVTSPLNRVALFRREHRLALPLLPWASNRMTIDADVVIASSSGWAHGFPTRGVKIVYCHSPARWLYAGDDYLGGSSRRSVKGVTLELLKWPLLRWDARAAATADVYVANAQVIRERIRHAYGREADVVPPPFGVDAVGEQEAIPEVETWARDRFALVVSRLMPYKNVDTVIDAFRGTSHRVLVIGAGPMVERLRAEKPANAEIVSGVSDAQLRWAYAHCTGLVAASYEDFGLTPLEAAAFGKPVAALRAGGYLDTVVEGRTGIFFETAEPAQILSAWETLTVRTWGKSAIQYHADGFSEGPFAENLHRLVEATVGHSDGARSF